MDVGLREYLEARFCGIQKQLTLMQEAVNAIDIKIDVHGDRILIAEKDINQLADIIREARCETKERISGCQVIMDKKDEAVTLRLKYWAMFAVLGGVVSILSMVITMLIKTFL